MFSYVLITIVAFAGAFALGKMFSNARKRREFKEALERKWEEDKKKTS